MKKIKIMMVLSICLIFGVNAFAAGKHAYNHNNYQKQYQKQNKYSSYNRHKNIKGVKHVSAKPKKHHKNVQKTVVVHHYEKPRHNPSAEAVAFVGLGIIATAAIAKAVF